MGTKGIVGDFYKSLAEDLLMFGFVQGQKNLVPTITIEQAVRNFGNVFGLHKHGFNEDSAIVMYNRMTKRYYNACSTKENK